jgi:hypothetical protein
MDPIRLSVQHTASVQIIDLQQFLDPAACWEGSFLIVSGTVMVN